MTRLAFSRRFSLLGQVGALVMFIACATQQEAVWKTVPDSSLPFDKAWVVVSNAVSQNFDLETVDGQTGYLRTAWKVTNKDLFGKPMGRTRVVVRVENREPFRVKLKAEKQKLLFNNWQDEGNDEKVETDVLNEISARLGK